MNGIKVESDDPLQPLAGATGPGVTCCLIDNGQRCMHPTGNASYSKRIAKTVQQRRLKLVLDQTARHIYICDEHKTTIQHLRNQQRSRDSPRTSDRVGEPSDKAVHCEINFVLLPVNLLRRYKRHFKLPTRPGTNKAQLADIVARHFVKLPVNEKEVLTYFLYMCKNSNKSSRIENSCMTSAGAGGAESSN
jgi:histone deacetylase complex subunit SAP30